MSDFVISGGIRFDPKDIDTSAITKAITNAAASASITLGKISLSKDIKNQIEGMLSDIQLRLSDKNISLGISSKIGNQIAAIIQESVTAKPLKLQINPEYLRNQIEAAIKSMGNINVQIGASPRAGGGRGGIGAAIVGGAGGGKAGGGFDIDKEIAKREAAIAKQIAIEERRLLSGEVDLAVLQKINAEHKTQEVNAQLGVTEQSKYLERLKKATDLQSLIDNEKEAELKLLKYLNAEQQRELLAKKKAALGITGPAAPTPAEVTAARTAKTAGMAAVPVAPEEVAAKVAAAQRAAELKTQVAAALPPKPAKAPPPPVEPGDALRKQTADMEKLIATTTSAERAQNSFNKLLLQGAGSAETFGAKIGQITTRFTAYLVSLKAIFAVQQAFASSLKFIFDYDNALQEVQKILQALPSDLQLVSKSLFDVANNTGKSVTVVAESFNGFIRAGLGTEEALKRTEAAMLAMNATGLDVAESTSLITSALTVYKNELKDGVAAIDALTVADTMSAASSSEIARAFLRSGGAAEAIGVSYKELTGIIAGTIEATQLSGSTIGAALKTIFANLASNAEQLRATANGWGANILAGEDLYVVLQKLAAIYPTLNREQVAQINQIIAGKRRFTELSGLLGNFGKIEQIVAAEMQGGGDAAARNRIELEKLSSKVQLAKNSFFELVTTLSGVDRGKEGIGSIRDSLGDIIGLVTSTLKGITSVVDAVKSLNLGFITGSGLLTTIAKAAFFTYGLQAVRGIVSGFKQFMAVAMGIGQTLQSISGGIKVVTTETKTVTAAQTRYNNSLQSALKSWQEMKLITGQIASKAAGGGGMAAAAKQTVGGVRGFLKDTNTAVNDFLSGPAGMAVQIGIMSAIQTGADAFRKAAKDAADASDAWTYTVADSAAKGADLAVSFGMMLGPIGGVIAGLTAFTASLIVNSVQSAAAGQAFAKGVEMANNETMDYARALAIGGEYGKQAFIELVGSSADLNTAIVDLSTFMMRLNAVVENSENGFAKLAVKSSLLVDSVRRAVTGTERALDMRKEMDKAAEEFRKKVADINLQISLSGPVLPEFQAVQDKMAAAQVAMDKIKTTGGEIAGVWTKQHQIMALNTAEQSNTNKTALEMLRTYGITNDKVGLVNKTIDEQRSKIDELIDQRNQEEQAIKNIASTQEYLKKAQEGTLTKAEKLKEAGWAELSTEQIKVDAAKRLATLNEQMTKAAKDKEMTDKNITEAGAKLLELEGKREEEAKALVKDAQQQVIAYQGIAQAASLIPKQLEAAKKAQADQMGYLGQELSDRLTIAQATLKGGTLAEQAAIKELASRQAIERQITIERDKRKNTIIELEKAQKEATDKGQLEQAAAIQKTITEMKAMGPVLEEALRQKLEMELNIQRVQVAQEDVKKSEEALREIRIRNAQMVIEEEMRVSQRRIDLIKKFGETAAGRKYLEKEYRPSQYAERNFGLVGAILIEEFTKSAQLATQGAVAELDMMRINGSKSLADLRKAMEDVSVAEEELADARKKGASAAEIKTAEAKLAGAEGALKKVKEGAVDAFERVQKAQEIQALALQKNEELKAQIQEQVLARVQDSIDNVNSAEERLIAIRNKIPEANAKVIESERAYGEASGEVNKATEDLMKAYQELADAQYGLAADIAMAEFSARQSVGAFSGAADAIGFLRSKWGEINSTVKASTQAQLELRRRMAQEEMNILKTQFDALKSLGQRAATAGPEEIAKMREQFAAAQAIAAGRATPAEFDPEILQGLDAFASLVPGLEKALTSFGLEQLGINPSVLDQMGQDIIGLSEATADGGKAQVDQAVEQVKLAQENLNKAEEQKQVALQNLQVSVQQRDAILAQAGNAQMAVNLAQAQLNEQMFSASQQLKILEEDKWANEQLMALYNKAVEVEQQAVNEITLLRESSLAKLEELKTAVVAAVAASKSSSPTTAPTAARGTLTMSEFNSLYGAARRESRAMPPGARLMMANTSETVLTRRQSKMMGLAPKVVPNAQAGNAAIDPTALTAALTSALKNAMATTPVQQNVTIQLDQAKTIDVRGLDGIDSAMRSAFEERAGRFADADEQKAIADIVKSMVGKLSELGVNNSLGY